MHLKPADGTVFKYSPRACFTTRGHAPPARKIAGRLDEVSEGEEGLFGQRLAVVEDAARLGVADDPPRVEEGDGAARDDRFQVAAAELAPQFQPPRVHAEIGGGWEGCRLCWKLQEGLRLPGH
uniref:Uncharacterized protein n=1 Tax=Emiliania huxleyi TaxID=2903 RepID=A0A6V2RBE6_EMIHU